jgi:hypothetical protein
MLTVPEWEERLRQAIELIGRTPGYAEEARELADLLARGRIGFAPNLDDRALVTLTGRIQLGPEALDGPLVGLAATLIHEHFHLHQSPFLKTASFWAGVATRTPVLRRYERPAYTAALRFLQIVAATFPDLATTAQGEAAGVAATFAAVFGAPLIPDRNPA